MRNIAVENTKSSLLNELVKSIKQVFIFYFLKLLVVYLTNVNIFKG